MHMMIIAAASLPLALGACGKKAEQPVAAATAASPVMDKMAMPEQPRTGTGEGRVVSVNAATGAISIEHGPIKQLDWPSMTMGFAAKSQLLKGVAVGDKVAFEIKGAGENYELTSIHKE